MYEAWLWSGMLMDLWASSMQFVNFPHCCLAKTLMFAYPADCVHKLGVKQEAVVV